MLGSTDIVAEIEARLKLAPKRLSPRALGRAGQALGIAATVQESSGRWVKLTKESAQLLKDLGISNPTSGVARGDGGRILKHLVFEPTTLLSPTVLTSLAAVATQASLEASLDEIKEYLEEIDQKLDQLLQQRKIQALGQLGGVTLAIQEADAIHAATGTVSAVTWSKVQANSLALQTMQAESIAQLHAIADRVQSVAGDTDESARMLEKVEDDVTFWLGVLARTLALQDRQYVLELARVADSAGEDLESHRQGITIARTERGERIARSLGAINGSVRAGSDLSNFARVANPFSSRTVTQRANAVNRSVEDFAEHSGLELVAVEAIREMRWGGAVKALVGDAVTQVGSAGAEVADRAKTFGGAIQERSDDTILALAERVSARREAAEPSGSSDEVTTAGSDDSTPKG
ncbi:hypothetical protein [Schumannella soli]|uniref:Uncharacterized protein n=1 Tax=Schumannella soli TaxID=2590779 RepID=A0A506Y885_9MICO|nr:hypothetical protein [Schumannella soli]TPW77710.1 hypothetical protein FJ657_03380 [Schumannella soli]